MGSVVGQLLPLAVGIAISPVPIIATVLMLLSPRAKASSVGFLLGWIGGIAVGVVVFTLVSSLLPERSDGPRPIAGTIQIVLGVALVVMAIRQWRSRPTQGADQKLPAWMKAIDTMNAGKALSLGVLLSTVNPKNLLLTISAGVGLGGAGLAIGQLIVAVAIYTVIAASTVLLPVLAYLTATNRMAKPLQALHEWLTTNNAAIMTVLLLVLGVSMIGKGLGGL